MPSIHSIFFIGADTRTRAEVTKLFSTGGWQISPADSFDEFDAVPVKGAVALCYVKDAGDVAEVQEQMARRGHWLPLITCCDGGDHRLIVKAVQSGSHGHLVWPFDLDEFAGVLDEAEIRMEQIVRKQSARASASRRLQSLSRREREVLAALARFGSNKRIALELDLSPRTVEIYRSKIMQRLGVSHVAQALWLAFQSEEFVGDPQAGMPQVEDQTYPSPFPGDALLGDIVR
ncbi:response regulator transcription factor [Croceibacterium atlanticum]|nr:LuxR C-terminal-related transcriptional regulator [Croceibacterium atlanticum]